MHVKLPQFDISFAPSWILPDSTVKHNEGLVWISFLPIDVYFTHCDLTIVVNIVLD